MANVRRVPVESTRKAKLIATDALHVHASDLSHNDGRALPTLLTVLRQFYLFLRVAIVPAAVFGLKTIIAVSGRTLIAN